MNESAPKIPSFGEAMAQILQIEHMTEQTGAVDSERDAFKAVRQFLEANPTATIEAIQRALSVKDNRQLYH